MGAPCPGPDTMAAVEPLPVGRIFEGSAVRTGDELNAAVVGLALSYGWAPTPAECWHDSAEDLRRAAQNVSGWLRDDDAAEALTFAADNALTWLGEHAVPPGHVIVSDDGVDVLPASEAGDLYGWGE
jgi:hypothetical protein